jgi:hypothetical protein
MGQQEAWVEHLGVGRVGFRRCIKRDSHSKQHNTYRLPFQPQKTLKPGQPGIFVTDTNQAWAQTSASHCQQQHKQALRSAVEMQQLQAMPGILCQKCEQQR